MKRFNNILNTIIGVFIGVFIGNSVFRFWNYKTNPNMYGMQSAPWYISILVEGAFTICVLLVILVVKFFVKRSIAKREKAGEIKDI